MAPPTQERDRPGPAPPRRSPLLRIGAVALVGLVLAAGALALGGGRDGDGGSDPTTTTSTPAATGSGEAGRWAVGPGDLPDGWSEAQVDMAASSDPAACGLDEGDPAVVVDRVAVAYDAPAGSGLNLGSTGLLVADPEIGEDLLQRVIGGEVAECVRTRITDAFSGGDIELRDLEVGSSAIPEGASTVLSYELVVNGAAQPITQEQVVMVDGDRVAIVALTSGSEPFPQELRSQVLGAVGDRLATP
jgi:hypothetical protein